jgi:oligoendopeptidase F
VGVDFFYESGEGDRMHLTPFVPRQFLPEDIDLTDLAQLQEIFVQLTEALTAAKTVAELEHWLEAYGEVESALDQERSSRYIAMTCQTDDAEREQAYMLFVERIDPELKPKHFALAQALVAHPEFNNLSDYYAVHRRNTRTYVELFREMNVVREKEEAKLTQAYQKTCGAMMVTFEGKEQTLVQVSLVLEETDRARRQAAWEAIARRRLEDKETFETLFDDLLKLRVAIAQEAACPDYRAYTFRGYRRFDYTPEDCLAFHQAIESQVVPLARQLQEERRQRLGLDKLRPWDLAVDPEHNPPLRPFTTGVELIEKMRAVFGHLDPRLQSFYEVMVKGGLMDLENRQGKAPGGYQSTLAEARVPFIFMNAVGQPRDVETLLHEAGHAFHTMASREQTLSNYRHAPIEFCEVASMGMELLAAPFLSEFYSAAELKRARRDHLEGIIKFFPWMATVDAFQHWIYTHPEHTRAERQQYWLSLLERFGGTEDWSGYEEARAHSWHRQLHIFEYPFYYVEYGIAQLGALQLWALGKQDLGKALDGYLAGLALGGSKPLPELFAASGLVFDFRSETMAPLIAELQREIKACSITG